MNKRKLILLVIPLFFSLLTNAQTPYLDSLYQVYQTDEVLSKKYKNLYRYCFGLMQTDSEKAAELIEEAESKIYSSGLDEAESAYIMGLFAEVKANIEESNGNAKASLKYFQQCYDFSEKAEGEKKYVLQGTFFIGMGTYYGRQKLYKKSTQNFLKAKVAFKKANQPGKEGDCYAMLAQNYQAVENYDSTIWCCNKALALIDPEKDLTNKFYYSFFKANAFNASNRPDSTIAMLSGNYLDEAKATLPTLYAHIAFALADAYSTKKMIPQAKKYILSAKKIAVDSGDQLYYNYLNSNLKLQEAAADYPLAFQALHELRIYEDSLNRSLNEAKFMELQSKYDAQNKDFEITSLKNENRYQSNMMKLGGSLFAIILASLFFWFKNREEKIKAIQAKNNQQIKLAFKYDDPEPEIEDDFLKNITLFIQRNLTNEDFSVDDLVRHSGMNRNSMNKKLKSLTNHTAVGLIRDVRLERSHTLLLKNGKNVSQVAFEVGFKDPNYFSSCFREKFGFPPSEILKKSLET